MIHLYLFIQTTIYMTLQKDQQRKRRQFYQKETQLYRHQCCYSQGMSQNAFPSWKFLDLIGIYINGQILYKTLRIQCMIKRSFTDDIRMDEISFSKLKSVLDLSQITNENRAGLRAFHQHLKSVIMWLNLKGDTSAINSIEKTTKAITILPRYLRSKFHRDFKHEKLNNQSVNLKTFEISLGNKVAELFNTISAIIYHQEKQKRILTKVHIAQKEIT